MATAFAEEGRSEAEHNPAGNPNLPPPPGPGPRIVTRMPLEADVVAIREGIELGALPALRFMLSPANSYVAQQGFDGRVSITRLSDMARILEIPVRIAGNEQRQAPEFISFSPNENLCAIWGDYGPAEVYRLFPDQAPEQIDHPIGVNQVSDKRMQQLRTMARTPDELAQLVNQAQGVRAIHFSESGEYFAVEYLASTEVRVFKSEPLEPHPAPSFTWLGIEGFEANRLVLVPKYGNDGAFVFDCDSGETSDLLAHPIDLYEGDTAGLDRIAMIEPRISHEIGRPLNAAGRWHQLGGVRWLVGMISYTGDRRLEERVVIHDSVTDSLHIEPGRLAHISHADNLLVISPRPDVRNHDSNVSIVQLPEDLGERLTMNRLPLPPRASQITPVSWPDGNLRGVLFLGDDARTVLLPVRPFVNDGFYRDIARNHPLPDAYAIVVASAVFSPDVSWRLYTAARGPADTLPELLAPALTPSGILLGEGGYARSLQGEAAAIVVKGSGPLRLIHSLELPRPREVKITNDAPVADAAWFRAVIGERELLGCDDRTIVFSGADGSRRAIRFLGSQEDASSLARWRDVAGFLHQQAVNGIELQSALPVPLDPALSMRRVLPGKAPASVQEAFRNMTHLATHGKHVVAVVVDNYHEGLLARSYESPPALSAAGITRALHDLFLLARHGAVIPNILEAAVPTVAERAVPMLDLMIQFNQRIGMRGISAWQPRARYDGFRAAGLSRWQDLRTLPEATRQEMTARPFGEDGRHLALAAPPVTPTIEKCVLAHYLSSYLVQAVLNLGHARLLCSDWDQPRLVRDLQALFETSYTAFTREAPGKVSELVDWTRLALQMRFFMTSECDLAEGAIPDEVYGTPDSRMQMGGRWPVVSNAQVAAAFSGTTPPGWFRPTAARSQTMCATSRTLRSLSNPLPNQRPDSPEARLRQILTPGRDENLGRPGTPFFLQELTKAAYAFVLPMMRKCTSDNN